MIKPNICTVMGHETGATTNPFVVRSLVEWLLQNYDVKSTTIGEADATKLNADIAFKALGWEKEFKQFKNVKLMNLTKDERIDVKLNGLYFKNLKMSKTYMESDFLVSVGKLKTHTLCGITCILKNQFGANPIKYKKRFHKHLSEVIYDLNKVRLPDLCLVDGLIGMEGEGPIDGVPKPLGVLIVGNDPVSVDHVCIRIMGFRVAQVPHLRLAIEQKLGNINYEIFGESIKNVETKFRSRPLYKRVTLKIYQTVVRAQHLF